MSIKFEFLDCKQQKTTESNLSRIGIYWDEFVAKLKVKKKKKVRSQKRLYSRETCNVKAQKLNKWITILRHGCDGTPMPLSLPILLPLP